MSTRLIELVGRLPGRRVVVLGDVMIDRYLYGNAERLSPEAPVPVMHYQYEQTRLGGAGRVVEDLAELGAEVRVVSVVGADEPGGQIRRLISDRGADVSGVIELSGRPSTSKVRLVGLAQHRHPQQMIRLDYEDTRPVDGQAVRRVLSALETALEGAVVLCIEDYDKGLVCPEVCRGAIELARRRGIAVLLDPAAISDYSKYAGATAITPNRTEASRATGLPCDGEADYAPVAEALLEALDLEAVVLTLDRHGAYLASRDGERRWLRTRAREVYDVTGAGDMVLAMLALARPAGANWSEAVALANIAGGLEVEQAGSVPITRRQIVAELLREVGHRLGKERALDPLLEELEAHRASGRKIVFTNGCFDLIHLGHVNYFQFARSQGDLLVVAVNTDAGIRRLKGPKRPIIGEDDRIAVLEELESIDYLIRFDDDTPLELIRRIRPDVLVKGADYTREQVVGGELVESYGGRIALAPLISGRSTSAVIERILEVHRSG